MMRGLIRFIPWWIVVAFLILTIAWQSRLQIAEFALGIALKGLAVDDLDYQLENLDFSGLEVSRFSFSLDNPEQRVSVSGKQLAASYTLENLYRGQLNEIRTEELEIQIQEAGTDTLIRVAPENYLKLIELAINMPVPVAQISVNELSVEQNGKRAQRYNPVSLLVTSEQDSTKVELIHSRWQAVVQTTIVGDNNRISANLTNGDTDAAEFAALKMEIHPQKQNMPRAIGSLTLSLENFLRWGLKPLEETSAFAESEESAIDNPVEDVVDNLIRSLEGDISVDFSIITDSTDQNSRLDLQASSPVLHYLEQIANNINLAASIDFPKQLQFPNIGKLDLTSLDISVEQLATPEILVRDLRINNQGTITLNNKTFSATVKPPSRIAAGMLDVAGLHLENALLDPALTFVAEGTGYRINLLRKTAFSADELKTEQLSAVQLQTRVTQDLKILLPDNEQDNQWKIKGGKLVIESPDFKYHDENIRGIQDATLKAKRLEIETERLNQSSQALRVSVTSPEILLDQQSIALESVTVNLDRHRSSVKSSGEFEFRDIPPTITFSMEAEDINKQFDLSLNQNTPLELSLYYQDLINILDQADLGNDTFERFNFDQGELSGNVQASWNSRRGLVSLININLNDVSGQFNSISFNGLNIAGPITLPPGQPHNVTNTGENKQTNVSSSKNDSATININYLEYGAELEKIEMNIRLIESQHGELAAIKINDLKAEILGSVLSSPEFIYDPGTETSHINLSVNNLDIGKVIELQQIDGLDATGKLDGTLPLEISDQGLSVKGGRFSNQKDGGTIHYKVDPSVAQSLDNPLTDTVLNALSEFTYQVLTADVDYQTDGELLVNFHIEGSSPHLENNRPVHLNINSEQNVLSLLESLEYANNLNRGIDKKLRGSLPVSE